MLAAWFASVTLLAGSVPAPLPSDSTPGERFAAIPWLEAGTTARIGSMAEVRVPAGCKYTGKEGTKTFMELTENTSSESEEGTIFCEDPTAGEDGGFFFVVFSFEAMGFVKDDERDALDADAILASLKEGNEVGNEARRERGWETLELTGWDRAPFYDPRTNNLTWATILRTPDGHESVNHSVRLLGRRGVMNVDLVMSPGQKAVALPALDSVVASFAYVTGEKYAEWREGDKVAAVGLTGLVLGGAGVVAAKTGLLGKLGKLLAAGAKFIVIGVVALWAFIKKLVTGKKDAAGTATS